MNLKTIIDAKTEEIRHMKEPVTERSRPLIDPAVSLIKKPFIAEIKRSSPSMGEINPDTDIAARARLYEEAGAGAISVLTDTKFFNGGFPFLSETAAATGIPVLCKDFIMSEVQIENAYASGADFILLIARILGFAEMKSLARYARKLGMKVLFELHSADEIDRIKCLDPEIVGVNSRDLSTFKLDREYAAKQISLLEGPRIKVAESGIAAAEDVRFFREHGASAFLVGTALMRAADPKEALSLLMKGLN
jgi:indole-3-glycerol phosphate synthase